MSFEIAAIIVLAVLAVVLGLVSYHLLGRLDMLERSVQGGLEPPTTRLSREQFERRFRTAHARSEIAQDIGTGVLLVTGPEYGTSALARTCEHLAREDLFRRIDVDELDGDALGITTTPYLFIVDDQRIRHAQPVAGASDVADAMKRFA